jgi:hypothetical protein
MTDQPRHVAIRDGVLNHRAHHRGQLTVYLRLNDEKVAAIYRYRRMTGRTNSGQETNSHPVLGSRGQVWGLNCIGRQTAGNSDGRTA